MKNKLCKWMLGIFVATSFLGISLSAEACKYHRYHTYRVAHYYKTSCCYHRPTCCYRTVYKPCCYKPVHRPCCGGYGGYYNGGYGGWGLGGFGIGIGYYGY